MTDGAIPKDGSTVDVLLVDDQELVRSGLRRILRRKDGFSIVGECADGDEVPREVLRNRPDVVAMDLRMKRVSRVDAIRALRTGAGPPAGTSSSSASPQGSGFITMPAPPPYGVSSTVRWRSCVHVRRSWAAKLTVPASIALPTRESRSGEK